MYNMIRSEFKLQSDDKTGRQVCDYHLLYKVSITASVVPMVVGGQQRGQGHLGDQNKQQDYERYL